MNATYNTTLFLKILDEVLTENLKSVPEATLAFSGGIDSSLLAFLCSKKIELELVTVCLRNSHDYISATESALLLNLPFRIITPDEKEIIEEYHALKKLLNSPLSCPLTNIELSFMLPFYISVKESRTNNIICGQGADELFGGYSRYLKIANEYLNDVLKTDIESLISVVQKREYIIAEKFQKKLLLPYLDCRIIEFGLHLPSTDKVFNGIRKIFLRNVLKESGLPEKIYHREKKAAQYSSGIWRIVRQLDRKEI